jgi:chromosome segregation ATPase
MHAKPAPALTLDDLSESVPRSSYDSLQSRLRAEEDDSIQTGRAFQNLKLRYDTLLHENRQLQSQLISFANRPTAPPDRRIPDLERRVARDEGIRASDRQTVITAISAQKRLENANQRCEAQIHDLELSIEELLGRNRELARALEALESENKRAVADVRRERQRTADCERVIAALKAERRPPPPELPKEELAEARQKLAAAESAMAKAKARIADLEKAAAKMQTALSDRNREIERLGEQADDAEAELMAIRQVRDEMERRMVQMEAGIEEAREKEEGYVRTLKAQEEFRKREMEGERCVSEKLTREVQKKEAEIKKLRTEFDLFLSKTYGLPEAVNEMRQLRVMVSVRDAQIADMIMENGWYQKMIAELETVFPPSFDFEEFYAGLERERREKDGRALRHKALEIVQRAIAERKDPDFGRIEIVIGPAREVYVASNNADGELELISSRSRQGEPPKEEITALRKLLADREKEITELKARVTKSAHPDEQQQSEIHRLRADYEKEATKHAVKIQEMSQTINQKDHLVMDLRRTVERLEKRLVDQKAEFTVKIRTLCDLYQETGDSLTDLGEVEKLIQRLAAQKQVLEQKLHEAQRQNQQLLQRIEVKEKPAPADPAIDIGKLKRRIRELEGKQTESEQKMDDLQRKYEGLRRRLADPRRGNQPSDETLSDFELPAGDANAEIKAMQVRCEKVRVQNEELQLRLGKSQATVERLNQLVQRKEAQLASLQAQLRQRARK